MATLDNRCVFNLAYSGPYSPQQMIGMPGPNPGYVGSTYSFYTTERYLTHCVDRPTPAPGGFTITSPSESLSPDAPTLDFTTSEYGRFLPIVFGRDKLTGNVFWSSGIQRQLFTTSGGEQQYYDYVSFALAVCEGPVDGVLRIWLGEKLILDNTSSTDVNGVVQDDDGYYATYRVDLVSEDSPLRDIPSTERTTGITVFRGTPNQLPNGIMPETEGVDSTPGYRGVCYLVFENFIITDATIPNIYVEVVTSQGTVVPRMYAAQPSATYDELTGKFIEYNSSLNVLLADSLNTGTNVRGLIVYDGNTLDILDEQAAPLLATVGAIAPTVTALTQGGHVITHEATVANSGLTKCFKLRGGFETARIGPAGDVNGHDEGVGFAICETFIPFSGTDGITLQTTDYICGIGFANRSIGFASVSREGALTMFGESGQVLKGTVANGAPYLKNSAVATTETFEDGTPTEGVHFYFFSGTSTEDEYFNIHRATIVDPLDVSTNMANFTATLVGTIDLDVLGGRGFVHKIQEVWSDDSDGTFIIMIAGTSRPDRIVKYNPRTNALEWNTALPASLNARTAQQFNKATWLRDAYCYLDINNDIWRVDLTTGTLTRLFEDIVNNFSLPAPSVTTLQCYDGLSDTLFYFAYSATIGIVRVFLNRVAASEVAVSYITSQLLQRIGLLESDIDISDLQILSTIGYTVDSARSLRTIFSELATVYRFDIIETNGRILYKTRGDTSSTTIEHEKLGDIGPNGWLEEHQEPDFARSRKINLTYRDIDREYDRNVQSVALPQYRDTEFDQETAIDVTVPIVLQAQTAKSLAELLLYSKIVYSSTYRATLPPEFIRLDPADVVTLERSDTESITMRLRDVSIGEDRSVVLSGSKEDPDIYNETVTLFGNIGRFTLSELDRPDSRIEFVALPIGFRSNTEAATVDGSWIFYYAMLDIVPGAFPNFAEFPIYFRSQQGTTQFGTPFSFPDWGYVVTTPDNVPGPFSTDFTSVITVKMQRGTPVSAASLEAMIETPQINLALCGEELIQFQTVASLGDDTYELTVLNRGKFGTDLAVSKHRVGEFFILLGSASGVLDENSIIRAGMPIAEYSREAITVDFPYNTGMHPPWSGVVAPYNLVPFAVTDMVAAYDISDNANVSWQRRDRLGAEWTDDGDFEEVPLSETVESYILYLYTNPATFSEFDPQTYLRQVELTTNSYSYLVADQTADGFDNLNDTLYILVAQRSAALTPVYAALYGRTISLASL